MLPGLKGPYSHELRALPATYRDALSADAAVLGEAFTRLGQRPALFIGSGGTMAVALVGAYLHELVRRQPARAVTALEAVEAPPLERRGAVLFSSSAKHPDARRVLADFRRARFRPTLVLTHRNAGDLQPLAGPDTTILTLPSLQCPDGFLATGSILQLIVLLLRAYGLGALLGRELNVDPSGVGLVREELLVLTPPTLLAVAQDIEVRLVESGLAAVQIADYRNFAHGRHTGFARRATRTTVIALSDRLSAALADATTQALPPETDLRRWHSDSDWPVALVDLLVRSMHLAGAVGEAAGLDVARPSVPAYGRALYRLPLSRRVPAGLVGGVERKLLALGSGDSVDSRSFYESAAAEWSEGIRSVRFAGLVLDYDGTVCWTSRRRALPGERQRSQLSELLERGLYVGFASGRGQSLYRDLREWISPEHWPRVLVGLYNGAVRLSLAADLPDLRAPSEWSTRVVAALRSLPLIGQSLAIEERGAQVTIEVRERTVEDGRLPDLIRDRLATDGIAAQVLASGHSVDIVAPETSKRAVSADLETLAGGDVLAIGDQGQLGGNDHALLAATRWSLSVDRCSADPSRCWFAGDGKQVGPDHLAGHLGALKRRGDGFELTGIAIT